ncbi:hypothetical protein BDW71DRAFT_204591 [Aspergillus fruticulosus]
MTDTGNIRGAGTMKKGTRKSMPKVRTGCLTCKQRRVKCDEGKPACRNCERTGRRCEGYPRPAPAPTPAGDSSLQVQGRPQQITVYNLPFKVPGSQADRQLLHFYTCEAAGGLSSFSAPTLWTKLILQRSHHQPVVRHALVTLSALYRDYLQGGNRVQASASHAAMQRIAKCHRQLRLYLRSPDASADIALICSILFFAFETLIGDCNTATQHLDNGLQLLKRCQMQRALNKSAHDELLPHLMFTFSRLDIHASTFDDDRIPILTLVSPEETSGLTHAVPSSLSSVDEAETVATKLQNWLMHHLIAHVAHKHKPLDEFPRGLLRERFVLYQQFERFFFAFAALLSSLPGDIPPRALLLRIQVKMYYSVLIENIPNDSFGPCAPADSLRNTLADIERFLSMESTRQTTRTFTLSSQLVAILYFMCLKTPKAERRELAFALLKHSSMPAKDGLWESGKAASIIQTLIDQTKQHDPSKPLEETGGDVFSPEEGGLEHVFRELSNRPRPGCLPTELSTIENKSSEPEQPSDSGDSIGLS